jgi:hypothetical protein
MGKIRYRHKLVKTFFIKNLLPETMLKNLKVKDYNVMHNNNIVQVASSLNLTNQVCIPMSFNVFIKHGKS